MASFMLEVYVWSLKNHTSVADIVTGFHTYHDKNEVIGSNQPYSNERKAFDEGRNLMWVPKNRRPERLRDLLKDTEEFLGQNECVQISWLTRRLVQMVLSNGCVISFYLSGHCGDVERIFIDKSLVGKIATENVSDVYVNNSCMMVAHGDKTRLEYIYFMKRQSTTDRGKKVEKLANMDPKTLPIELPGSGNRRLKRKLCINSTHNMALVWWPSSVNDVWPWSPVNSDRDRSNIIVLSLNGSKADIVAYTRTEFDPMHVSFSVNAPNDVHSIEMMPKSSADTRVNVSLYQISNNKIARTSSTTIPLKSNVLSHSRNCTEEKLLLGCEDGTIVLCYTGTAATVYTKSQVVPNIISWHPSGCIFLVASCRGDIQAFDIALNPINLWLVSEHPLYKPVLRLSALFTSTVTLKHLEWCPVSTEPCDDFLDNADILAFSFDKGPIGVMMVYTGHNSNRRLSPVDLVREYIRHRQIDEAVHLLGSMNWDTQGPDCYICLSVLMNHLLKLPLNAEREGQMQAILGSFYAPKVTISDKTIMEYRDPISRLARRFFHHLLRYARFDKAFLLAVDIGARDLFMDIHYMALDRGETVLADVAYQKAEDIECVSLGSSSLEDFESEDEEYKEEDEASQQPQYSKVTQDRLSHGAFSEPDFTTQNHEYPNYSPQELHDDFATKSEQDGGYMEDMVCGPLIDPLHKTQQISLKHTNSKTNASRKNQPSEFVSSEIPIDDWSPQQFTPPTDEARMYDHRTFESRQKPPPDLPNRIRSDVIKSPLSSNHSSYDPHLSHTVATNSRFMDQNTSHEYVPVYPPVRHINSTIHPDRVTNTPVFVQRGPVDTHRTSPVYQHNHHPPVVSFNYPAGPHASNSHYCCLHNPDEASDFYPPQCVNHNSHPRLSGDDSSQVLSSVSTSSCRDSDYSLSSCNESSTRSSRFPGREKTPSEHSRCSPRYTSSDMSQRSQQFTPSDVSPHLQNYPSSVEAPQRSKRWSTSDAMHNLRKHTEPSPHQAHRYSTSAEQSRATKPFHVPYAATPHNYPAGNAASLSRSSRGTANEVTQRGPMKQQNSAQYRPLPPAHKHTPPSNTSALSMSRRSRSHQNLFTNDFVSQERTFRTDRSSQINTTKSTVNQEAPATHAHPDYDLLNHMDYHQQKNVPQSTRRRAPPSGQPNRNAERRTERQVDRHSHINQSQSLESEAGRNNGHRPLSRQVVTKKVWSKESKGLVSHKNKPMSASTSVMNRVGLDDIDDDLRRHNHGQSHNSTTPHYKQTGVLHKLQPDMERTSNAKVIHFGVV